jgi:hypothetical protein
VYSLHFDYNYFDYIVSMGILLVSRNVIQPQLMCKIFIRGGGGENASSPVCTVRTQRRNAERVQRADGTSTPWKAGAWNALHVWRLGSHALPHAQTRTPCGRACWHGRAASWIWRELHANCRPDKPDDHLCPAEAETPVAMQRHFSIFLMISTAVTFLGSATACNSGLHSQVSSIYNMMCSVRGVQHQRTA